MYIKTYFKKILIICFLFQIIKENYIIIYKIYYLFKKEINIH